MLPMATEQIGWKKMYVIVRPSVDDDDDLLTMSLPEAKWVRERESQRVPSLSYPP